jgi:hypothetical protein
MAIKRTTNTPWKANKAPHRTAIPLRCIAAGELGRYVTGKGRSNLSKVKNAIDLQTDSLERKGRVIP